MTDRCLDAAALTVALAGESGDAVARALDPLAGARLVEKVRALRPDGTRERRARVLAAAGLRLVVRARAASPDEAGARFIAAWVRSLDAVDRAGFVRGLGAPSLAALRRALPTAPTLDPARRSTATALVALVHRTAGRPLPLAAWSTLLRALARRDPLADPELLRASRVVRVSARADACLALAAEMVAR